MEQQSSSQRSMFGQFQPSILRGLHTTYSILTSWEEMYRIITQDKWVKEQTDLYRDTGDEKYKHALPAVTTAVQLDGKGKAMENIVGYTGVTHCDFDHIPTERLAEVMAKIKADPHTLLCNVSPSGKGVHIYVASHTASPPTPNGERESGTQLFLVSLPSPFGGGVGGEAVREPEEERLYYYAFMTANCYYADLLGLPYDDQCSNPNKTLSLSHDPDAYLNLDATPFTIISSEVSPQGRGDIFASEIPGVETPRYTEKMPMASADCPEGTALIINPVQAQRSAGIVRPAKENAAGTDAHLHWVKEYTDPIECAEKYVREKQGLSYTEGHRNAYLYNCLNMMNLLGVPRTDAESWLRNFDLPEREKLSVLKSGYKRTADFGKFERPYTWKEETKTKTKTKTKTETEASLSLCHNISEHPHTHTRARLMQFPNYRWPRFIQQMVECADTKPQRDVLFMSVITILGGMLGRTVKFNYSKRFWHPSLQTFVIAPPASGKSVISWARRLCDALTRMLEDEYYEKKKAYDKEKAEYDIAGKERSNMTVPVPPKMNLYQIAGNNSSSGIMENLDECDGWGLICESEADTLSAAINADYGNWGDILRKAFDHDLMIMFRRTNKERRKIENPCLSVLISGTPAQVKPLIVSAENGQFSREIFLQLPAINEFIDQFDDDSLDMDTRFSNWGKEWLEVWQALKTETGRIELYLSVEQRNAFNEHFSSLFHHANYTQPSHHMKSSVAREAINILRIMCVVAFFRAIEGIRDFGDDLRNLLVETEDRSRKDENGNYLIKKSIRLNDSPLFRIPDDIAADNVKDGIYPRYELLITDDDFHAVLDLAEPIYRYACDVLNLLPSTEAVRNQVSAADALLNSLPLAFNCDEAIAIGKELDLTESHVRNLLSELTASGKLIKPGRGKYELAFPSSVTSRACVCEDNRIYCDKVTNSSSEA